MLLEATYFVFLLSLFILGSGTPLVGCWFSLFPGGSHSRCWGTLGGDNLDNEGRHSNLAKYVRYLPECENIIPLMKAWTKALCSSAFSAGYAWCSSRTRARKDSMHLLSIPAAHGGQDPLSCHECSVEKINHHSLGIYKPLQTNRSQISTPWVSATCLQILVQHRGGNFSINSSFSLWIQGLTSSS